MWVLLMRTRTGTAGLEFTYTAEPPFALPVELPSVTTQLSARTTLLLKTLLETMSNVVALTLRGGATKNRPAPA